MEIHRSVRIAIIAGAAVLTAAAARAQNAATVAVGASLEGYYQFNWNRPPDRVVPLRAYDSRSDIFSIQQAALIIESAPSVADGRRVGGRIDLQFGQATETVQGSGTNEPRPNVYRHLWQAYGSYVIPIGRGLQADFGKFSSNLGYETNYAKDNHHFSRAYLFNFLPFYHMGARLTLPVSDTVTVMYALTNGVQQTEEFNSFKSSHISMILKPASNVIWTTSLYVGREQPDGGMPDGPDGLFRIIDSYVTFAATSALTLGMDANHVTNQVRRADQPLSLQGIGVYARYRVSTPSAVALRYERLDDEGLFGSVDQILQEVTATVEHTVSDGFVARAEFRRDWSNVRFAQNTALVGLVWWFGNKQGTW